MNPLYVLIDTAYSAKMLIKRVDSYGWMLLTRLKKNRKLNRVPLKEHQKTPYWNRVGTLVGGLGVFVVKHRCKDFATNRQYIEPQHVRELYRLRQDVEEVIRVLMA